MHFGGQGPLMRALIMQAWEAQFHFVHNKAQSNRVLFHADREG